MSITISFFSNFLNAHQLPVARELNANPEVNYAFIAMQRVDGLEGRACLNDDYPFVVRQYLGRADAEEAMAHAQDDDIVVFGDMAGDESYVRARAKTGKPFFRYSERLLKRGDWWAYMPPKRWRTYDRFGRYRKGNMYVLCASAFTARDLSKFGFPVERCLKWGYFPELPALGERPARKLGNRAKLLSVQRLIDWKRVDLQVDAARILRDRGCDFELCIVGDGESSNVLRRMVFDNGLDDYVELVGEVRRAQALEMMCEADVFLATSNRKEGWGAAVNEAMAAGCVVVASDQMGSVPYLIRDGVDGVVFPSGDATALADAVEPLLVDNAARDKLSGMARERIFTDWSAACAAERFVDYSKALLHGHSLRYSDGPLSPAGNLTVPKCYERGLF